MRILSDLSVNIIYEAIPDKGKTRTEMVLQAQVALTNSEWENGLAAEWAKRNGWVSLVELAAQDARDTDNERILSREAAFEEERFRNEVKYWKGKNYELGGR